MVSTPSPLTSLASRANISPFLPKPNPTLKGPLNLGHLYRYCQLVNAKLADPKFKDKAIYHFCSSHPHKRANSCFLIAAWSVLYQNKTPEEAFRPFRSVSPPFPTWHDATPTVCSFTLTILDTLNGLYKAREHRFFDLEKFNIEEYEYYEQVRPCVPSLLFSSCLSLSLSPSRSLSFSEPVSREPLLTQPCPPHPRLDSHRSRTAT